MSDATNLPGDGLGPTEATATTLREEIDSEKPTARGTRLVLLFARLLFMAIVLATPALVVASRVDPTKPEPYPFVLVIGLTLAAGALGFVVVVIDALTPNKRLASIFGIYLGLCLGLVGAYAIGTLLDSIVAAWSLQDTQAAIYVNLAKISIGCILCYIAVSVVMTTKDDFRLVIPYVEFSKQNRGVRPMVLDTSALIDGRILDVAAAGVLDAPFIIVQPVIDELQRLADSSDRGRRAPGRPGLDMIAKLQASPHVELTIEDTPVGGPTVDRGLIELARRNAYRVVTTDTALAKIGEIAGVPVINLNTLAGSMRAQSLPGDSLEIEIVRVGENPTQGVGYLADGTMVVVEGAADRIGTQVEASVTNSLTTSAGRLIFAKLADAPAGSPESMAARATEHGAEADEHGDD
ncbi:MAG: PIN/TRAM domain-containing protein, partial [Phycisphaerales bacterium]